MEITRKNREPQTVRVAERTAILPAYISESITDNTTAITAEAASRVAGDTALQTQIDTESTTRANDIAVIESNLEDETAARKAALALKVDKIITVSGSGLATGGGDLSANRTIDVAAATEAENLAGTNNTKAITPLANKIALKNGLNAFGSAINFGTSDNYDVVLNANNATRITVKGTITDNCAAIISNDIQVSGLTIGKGKANNSIVLGAPTYAVGTVTGANNLFLGSPTSVPLALANAVYIGGASSLSSAVNNSVIIADGAGNKRIEIDGSGHTKLNNDLIVMGDVYFDSAKTYGITFDNSTRLYVKLNSFTAQGFQNIGGAGTRITCPQYSGQTTAALYPVYSFTQSENSGLYMDQTPAYGVVKVGIATEGVRRFYIGSDQGTFTVPIQATGYKSSDGSTGATGTATSANTLTIKNGLIVAIT